MNAEVNAVCKNTFAPGPRPAVVTESEAAQLLSAPQPSSSMDDYDRLKREWIERHLEKCPPLAEHQKQIIRTAFAAHREEQAGAA